MNSFTRKLICVLAIAMATATTQHSIAADNPFGAVWPFGKKKQTTPTFTSPFAGPNKSAGNPLMQGPSQLLDKAEAQTDAFVKKTKDGWRGVQNFGRSMNPFAKTQKKKKSLLDTLFPKQPIEKGPATMGEFLTMKRPGF